jgi:hypothetical protein
VDIVNPPDNIYEVRDKAYISLRLCICAYRAVKIPVINVGGGVHVQVPMSMTCKLKEHEIFNTNLVIGNSYL